MPFQRRIYSAFYDDSAGLNTTVSDGNEKGHTAIDIRVIGHLMFKEISEGEYIEIIHLEREFRCLHEHE